VAPPTRYGLAPLALSIGIGGVKPVPEDADSAAGGAGMVFAGAVGGDDSTGALLLPAGEVLVLVVSLQPVSASSAIKAMAASKKPNAFINQNEMSSRE
jgi:hypothetical protein